MLGVAVLIVVISVMTGFDKELRDKILGFNAHLNVRTYSGKPIKNYRELAKTISSNVHVRAVAPYVLQQSFAETQPETGEPAYAAPYVRGIDPKAETNLSVLPKSIVDGQYNLRGNRIVVGQTFAMNYGLRVGDHLGIYSPKDLREMKEAREAERSRRVQAIRDRRKAKEEKERYEKMAEKMHAKRAERRRRREKRNKLLKSGK